MKTGMTWAEASEMAIENGYKIRRIGWNVKNMWVSYTPGKTLNLKIHDIWTLPIYQVAEENGGEVTLRPYFNLKTEDNQIQIGWVPSVSDILAEDWELIL